MNCHHQDPSQSSSSAKGSPEQTAIDPICGMSVDHATARHQAEYNGRTFYFCSTHCHEKFLTDPARYAGS